MYDNLKKSINNKFKIKNLKILMIIIYWLKSILAQDIFDYQDTTKYDIRCEY